MINNLENLSVEDLMKAFCYDGINDAWGEIFKRLRPRLQRNFSRKYQSQIVEECISRSFAKVYFKVKMEQERIKLEAEITGKTDLNVIDEFWKKEGFFDFSTGAPFQPWILVLVNNCILDYLKSNIPQGNPLPEDGKKTGYEDGKESELYLTNFAGYFVESPVNPNDFSGKSSYYDDDEEAERQLEIFRRILYEPLTEDEFIYFDIFWENGPANPSAKEVIKEFYARTGNQISDADVTVLKKSFRRKARLALMEAKYDIDRISDYITPIEESEEEQEANFQLMLENIWQSFIKSQKVVSEVMRGLPKYRWRTMIEAAQQGHNQIETRIEILQIAYNYFIGITKQPRFVKLIGIYSADRFGSKIKSYFKGNNGK